MQSFLLDQLAGVAHDKRVFGYAQLKAAPGTQFGVGSERMGINGQGDHAQVAAIALGAKGLGYTAAAGQYRIGADEAVTLEEAEGDGIALGYVLGGVKQHSALGEEEAAQEEHAGGHERMGF